MSDEYTTKGTGHNCDKCGLWIDAGNFHTCNSASQPYFYEFMATPYMDVLKHISDSLDKLVDHFVRNIR